MKPLMSLVIALLLISTSCLKKDVFTASGTPNSYMAILDIKKLYKGQPVVLSTENMAGASHISGVVVSDVTGGNIPKGMVVIQQISRSFNRGIALVFDDNTALPYQPGDSLIVEVQGATLSRKAGVLQISHLTTGKVVKAAEKIAVTPEAVTLAQLNSKFADYENTLVKVNHVDAAATAEAIAGNHTLSEISGSTVIMHTEAAAAFAAQKVPVNASYTGIARWINSSGDDAATAEEQLWPCNGNAIADQSGALYATFPESFENPGYVADGYSTVTLSLKTGSYKLEQAMIFNSANDRAVTGEYALRFNQNATSNSWCTMNNDLAEGASKLTIWAGSYGAAADLGSTWRVEYSQDKGVTWRQAGEDILTVSKVKEQYTFMLDIRGAVRFRIGKFGIGTSTISNQNGRFSLDDLAVYKHQDNSGGGQPAEPVPAFETVTAWQFGTPQSTGSEASYNATTNNAGLNTGVLTRGPGLTVPGTLTRGFTSWAELTTTTKADALKNNAYFQLTLSPKTGKQLSLTTANVKLRRSAAGARYNCWYYSLDGINFKQAGDGDVNSEGTDGEGVEQPVCYLYHTPELQHIPAGTTVTLRLYAWGFSNVRSGTFAIGRTPAGTTTPALSLGGKVE
jgi:hypothetical protein